MNYYEFKTVNNKCSKTTCSTPSKQYNNPNVKHEWTSRTSASSKMWYPIFSPLTEVQMKWLGAWEEALLARAAANEAAEALLQAYLTAGRGGAETRASAAEASFQAKMDVVTVLEKEEL